MCAAIERFRYLGGVSQELESLRAGYYGIDVDMARMFSRTLLLGSQCTYTVCTGLGERGQYGYYLRESAHQEGKSRAPVLF